MIGVQIDIKRMLAIAAALREQIPKASPEVAKPMIDAAGELQRMAEQLKEAARENDRKIAMAAAAAAEICQCATCVARRGAQSQGKPN